MIDMEKIDWAKGGDLVPAILQDARNRRVLMLGYMNEAALWQTIATGKVTFFSRTKQRLWVKGETSGHFLTVQNIQIDCDNDTLLILATPNGPVCHRGTATCFDEGQSDDSDCPNRIQSQPAASPLDFLTQLESIIDARAKANPEESYTARLFQEGLARMAQKVGEEGVEVALAAVGSSKEKLAEESADLLFHLLVVLRYTGLSLAGIADILRTRHKERAFNPISKTNDMRVSNE